MSKNNYPIRYALLPLYEKRGYLPDADVGLLPNFEIVGYIVSKCFVVFKTEEEFSSQESYQVVFPYQSVRDLDKPMSTPIVYGDRCINAVSVPKVFDNYDDALIEGMILNSALVDQNFYEFLAPDERELIDQQDNERIASHLDFENKIAEATKDLAIGKEFNPILIKK